MHDESVRRSRLAHHSVDAMLAREVKENLRLYFSLAHNILEDVTDAEDACQQAFLKAVKHMDRIDTTKLKAWLVEVVTNEALQLIRSCKIERKAQGKWLSASSTSDDDPTDQTARKDLIERGLARLPEPVRTIVVLRAMQGMSGNETAAVLGCSPSEVSKRFHEGMERLRHFFSGEGVTSDAL